MNLESDIKLEYGKAKELYLGPKTYMGSGETIEAFYIGYRVPATEPIFLAHMPEGHIFVRMNDEGNLEMYCTRSEKARLLYMSDGEDEPSYSVGIPVQEFGKMLPKNEEMFLRSRIEFWKQRDAEQKIAQFNYISDI
jgi:hypothetical protein